MMFMDKNIIPQSEKAMNYRLIVAGIMTLLVCLLVTLLFNTALGFGTNIEKFIVRTLWFSAIIMYAIAVLLDFSTRKKSKYVLDPDSLVVYKNRVFGMSKVMYRYDSMLAVEVNQSGLGSAMSAGSIVIKIAKLDNDIVLQQVLNPEKQAQRIKDAIVKHSPHSAALVV